MSDKEPIEQGFMDDETFLSLKLARTEARIVELDKELRELRRWKGQHKDNAGKLADAQVEVKKLTAAMWDAIECVEAWAAYASEYFREKHDLAGDLARLRAALKGKPGK